MQAGTRDDTLGEVELRVVRGAKAWGSGGRRILVVEDHVDLANTTQWVLQHAGHHVVIAYDGESALRLVETFSPELVLVDLDLPDLDGYALADRLRRHPNARDACLVAVTGWSRCVDVARLRAHGFATHFVKPFDLVGMLDVIEVVCGPDDARASERP